ncbi:MAG TPA: 50S ribosomal protein L13 [Methanocellales archaeon]|nr:50S ribosomal protein L13 [Methanocellales archaeon]
MTIINADGLILGRLASTISKRLLSGEEIIIVNAEKSVISGSKLSTFEKYNRQVNRGTREQGPYYPKRPDRILKRTIRGMLPYKRGYGRSAYSRLKVYIEVPYELQNESFETINDAKMTRLSKIKYMRLGALSQKLGAKWVIQ